MSRATTVNFVKAVTGTTAQFSSAMGRHTSYCIISSVPAWVRIGATGAAAEQLGTDSFYLPADTYLDIVGSSAARGFVNIIKVTGGDDGFASLIKTED